MLELEHHGLCSVCVCMHVCMYVGTYVTGSHLGRPLENHGLYMIYMRDLTTHDLITRALRIDMFTRKRDVSRKVGTLSGC